MSPEEFKLWDSAIKIGLGGLFGVFTSIFASFLAFRASTLTSKAKRFENSIEMLKECVEHFNLYHSTLFQYLLCFDHIRLIKEADGEHPELMVEQINKRQKYSDELFENCNAEVNLAAAKVLFFGGKKAHEKIKEYDKFVNAFYISADYSEASLKNFRVEIDKKFENVLEELSIYRDKLL